MKMTLREVRDHYVALSEMADLALPAKLSYTIARNLERLEREVKNIDKTRESLCKQYANKDENGEPKLVDSIVGGKTVQEYDMTPEHKREYVKEYEEFLDTEAEVDIRKASYDLIEQCEKKSQYNIPSVKNCYAMGFMLEE